MSSGGMGMGGMSAPPAPQPRSLAQELGDISQYSSQNAQSQADAAIRTNDAFQDQAQESTRDIARQLDNDYTRAARANLDQAQSGINQVNAANTGLGQLRDQYAAQGQDPAMRRLNDMAAGQLYRPDQIRAGQVAADQVRGAQVADIGRMEAAQAGPVADVQARRVLAAQGIASQMGQVADVQGPAGYDPNQVRAQRMRAAQMDQIGEVGVGNIRASAAERSLMNEARGGGLLGQLESRAASDLALGGSLSAEQSRDATQSARAAAAARGLGLGQSAVAAELLNRDRFTSQRENERLAFAQQTLNQGTGIRQAANQAYATRMEGNTARNLQAQLANQQTAFGIGQLNTQSQQQTALANQDANLRAALANQSANARAAEFQQQGGLQAALQNQQAALQTGQYNAGNQQQMALANMQNRQQASLSNQDAFLRAGLANQAAALQLGQTNANLQQQANAATFASADQRATNNAQFAQQAALANQSANLNAAQYNVSQDMSAQAQNQAANQQQEQYNRAFLGSVAGMNFDQNQARTSMLSGLYGQQAGLGQTSAALAQGMAQSQVALDPYQRALGSSMPIATISPSAGLIGQAYGQTMSYGQDLFNTNTNMQASIYNSFQNNQAALQGAGLQAGAARAAGQSSMMGSIGAGGLAAGGMIGAAVII
jgi:hypothetical protein